MKSVLKNVGMGLALVFIFFYLLGKLSSYSPAATRWIYEVQTYWQNRSLTAKMDKIKEQIAEDTMGGQTPEETFDLFLVALKAGDAKKAALYYVYNRQAEAEKNFTEALANHEEKKNTLEYFTLAREKGVKECDPKTDGCTFEYKYIEPTDRTTTVKQTGTVVEIKAGAENYMTVDIVRKNGYKIWKIEQPY